MTSSNQEPEHVYVERLVIHLAHRRQHVLGSWRTVCEGDSALNETTRLTSKQFNNQVPEMLDRLGERLLGYEDGAQFDILAAEHGLHRWQMGYSLSELATETQHLCRLLLTELRTFWQINPSPEPVVMAFCYEHLFEFGSQINTGSITQYADLQRQAASRRVDALQKTLEEINAAGKQRTDILRHSSHDLRGSFGVLLGAAALLEMVTESDDERKQLLEILKRNLSNCRTLVVQLMDLARLEAGQEVLHIQKVDAGQLLASLVTGYQPLAYEQRLSLKSQGPTQMTVQCDPVHLLRIIQNLVLNALKHTREGWVLVSWDLDNDHTWSVSVQDTGPGLPATERGGTENRVSAATDQSDTLLVEETPDVNVQHRNMEQQTSLAHPGEGVGLSIVKGLCELLRAKFDMESKQGEGTTFRIRLPRHWPAKPVYD